MASDSKWIDNKKRADGYFTPFNSKVALNEDGAIELARKQFAPSFTEVVFGEFTKWCTGLIFFPFDLTGNKLSGQPANQYIRIGANKLEVPNYYIEDDNYLGYTLGEYFYVPKYNDYRDFEPYSTVQIYLPYYGLIDVNPADVINKYIQFRLNVDFGTGQAMYVVGVNNSSVSPSDLNTPFSYNIDDSNTIIIGKYIFNIGVQIPLGQTGMAEMIRNVSMATITGAISAAGYATVASAGLATSTALSTSTNKIVNTARNPNTNRQIQTRTQIVTRQSNTEYDSTNYQKGRAINACFDSAGEALNAMNLKPSTDRANNPFVDFKGPSSVQIIRRYSKVLNINPSYGSLYGLPLGETKQLSTLNGYTEVTSIHFEGEGFASATNEEIAMLEQEFSDGIILPDPPAVPV